MLKDAESNPVMMGETVIENSQSEKYLGDMIHENGCAASIEATIKGRINGAREAARNIINSLNHPATMGHKMAEVAVTELPNHHSLPKPQGDNTIPFTLQLYKKLVLYIRFQYKVYIFLASTLWKL